MAPMQITSRSIGPSNESNPLVDWMAYMLAAVGEEFFNDGVVGLVASCKALPIGVTGDRRHSCKADRAIFQGSIDTPYSIEALKSDQIWLLKS
jgi:hypothetical protein